jgi:Domain of unknown function (DUF4397)
MEFPVRRRRTARLLGGLVLSAGLSGVPVLIAPAVSAAVTAQAGHRAPGVAWMRLAQLSPNAPAVDVYLYSFGGGRAQVVLHHVAYGTVSEYMRVTAGEYTVAIRPAGMPSKSAPVLSSTARIARGRAYTVAGVGTVAHLKLQILRDRLTAPRGKVLVRIMQESMHQPKITVTDGHRPLATSLAFGAATSFRVVSPGRHVFRAQGASAQNRQVLALKANSVHTVVVLDDSGTITMDDLMDAAGSAVMPMGGAGTGFGGTAPAPGAPQWPWLLALAGGGALLLAGAARIRRAHQPGS